MQMATHGHRRRIHQGGFDFFAKAIGVFQVGRQPRQNFRQQPALFPRRHHGNVKAVERLGMLLQRLGKTFAALHARADVANRVAHDLVGSLVGQRLQGLHDGNARVHHRRQLTGEHHQIGQRNLAALGLALSGNLFLDGNDQQIAVEQRGNGGLFGRRLHAVADFAARGRLTSGVSK